MTEQALNLFEFASSAMTETGASATKIMGCEMVNADSLGVSFYRIPDNISGHSTVQHRPCFEIRPEYFAFSYSLIAEPNIDQILTPLRHGYCSQPSARPYQPNRR